MCIVMYWDFNTCPGNMHTWFHWYTLIELTIITVYSLQFSNIFLLSCCTSHYYKIINFYYYKSLLCTMFDTIVSSFFHHYFVHHYFVIVTNEKINHYKVLCNVQWLCSYYFMIFLHHYHLLLPCYYKEDQTYPQVCF